MDKNNSTSNKDKTKDEFALKLTHSSRSELQFSLANNSDNKYRMVDVVYRTYSDFSNERFFSEEYFLMLAPLVAKTSLPLLHLDNEDTISGVLVLIDAYATSRSDTPRRHIVNLRTVGEEWEMVKQSSEASVAFAERKDEFVIHENVKATSTEQSIAVRRMLSPRFEKAINVAATAHADQKRKGSNIPYIIHPFGAMWLAEFETQDEDILIACLLHDVLEDVPDEYSREQMKKDFGERVLQLVEDVTKDSSIKDWKKRNEAYLEHLRQSSDDSVIVSASDKISNLGSILSEYEQVGEKLWEKFNAGKEDQLWWYESIYEIVRQRMPSSILRRALGQRMKTLRKIIKNG